MQDPIVEEVRRFREEHAAKFDYDIDAIYADLKRVETESKLPHVSLEPRRLSTCTASSIIPPAAAT